VKRSEENIAVSGSCPAAGCGRPIKVTYVNAVIRALAHARAIPKPRADFPTNLDTSLNDFAADAEYAVQIVRSGL